MNIQWSENADTVSRMFRLHPGYADTVVRVCRSCGQDIQIDIGTRTGSYCGQDVYIQWPGRVNAEGRMIHLQNVERRDAE